LYHPDIIYFSIEGSLLLFDDLPHLGLSILREVKDLREVLDLHVVVSILRGEYGSHQSALHGIYHGGLIFN
jgi:hypothetical protein